MELQAQYGMLFICGALGAVVKDILVDNKLILPKAKKGTLYLGCLGGMILGAIAGYIVDNDPVTAFLGGYGGSQIIENLVNNRKSGSGLIKKKLTVE